MADVSKLKFENGTYNIKDTTARNEINNLDQKIVSITNQLDGLEVNVTEYDIFPNTGEDITNKLKTLVETGANIVFPAGRYVVTDEIVFKHGQGIRCVGKVIIDGSDFLGSSGNSVIRVTNEGANYTQLPSLVGNVKKGDITLSFTTSHNLKVGDIVCLFDNTDFSWSSARFYYKKGEFCEVSSIVDSTTVLLSNELFDSYTQTGNSKFGVYKMNMGEFTLNGNIEVIQGKKGNTYAIMLERVKNFVSDKINVFAKNGNYAGFAFKQCFNVEFNGTAFQQGLSGSNVDYGLAIINSQHVRANGYFFGSRHGVTHTAVPEMCAIVNRDCITTGTVKSNENIGQGGVMAFNSHGNVEFITLKGNAYGGVTIAGKSNRIDGYITGGMNGICVLFTELKSLNHDFSGCTFESNGNPYENMRAVINLSGYEVAEVDNMEGGLLNLSNITLKAPNALRGIMLRTRNANYIENGNFDIDLSNARIYLSKGGSPSAVGLYIGHETNTRSFDSVNIKGLTSYSDADIITASEVKHDSKQGRTVITTTLSTYYVEKVINFEKPFLNNHVPTVVVSPLLAEVSGKTISASVTSITSQNFKIRLYTNDKTNFGSVQDVQISWFAQ